MYPDVKKWQARRESNPQPAVLETAALPIELLAYQFLILPRILSVNSEGKSIKYIKTTKPEHLKDAPALRISSR